MDQHHEDYPVINLISRTAVLFLAWVGSWTLADIQSFLGIISVVILIGYTATNWYVLWRDKIRRIENEIRTDSGRRNDAP